MKKLLINFLSDGSLNVKLSKVFILSFLAFYLSWVLVFYSGLNPRGIQSEDVVPSIFLPFSILKNQTLYLDNYYSFMISQYPQPDDKNSTPFYLKKIISTENYLDVHYNSAFPIINSLIVLPIYIFFLRHDFNWLVIYHLNHLGASFILALCSVFLFYFFYVIKRIDVKKSLLLILVFNFCTLNLSSISQSLWQHGAVELFLILSLIGIYKKSSFAVGLFFSLGLLSRPLFAIQILFLGVLYLYELDFSFSNYKTFKKATLELLKLLLGFVIPLGFFVWYTLAFYQDISNNGYYNQLYSWYGRFPEGFLGVWLSPSKGILIYSPIFILSIWVFIKYYKNFEVSLFTFLILAHTLIIGRWKHWYGGWSFGYRMSSDIIPLLIILLSFFVDSKYFVKFKALFYFLILISFIIQLSGLVFFDGVWHAAYDKGFINTSWLWSIKDSEFSFNLRRILVKFNYLDKACVVCASQ